MKEIISDIYGQVLIKKIDKYEYEFSSNCFQSFTTLLVKIQPLYDNVKMLDIYITRCLFGSCTSSEFKDFLKQKRLREVCDAQD